MAEAATPLVGRLGAISRGKYVIVVACKCPPYPDYGCNCHVAIFWKDEADGALHRDCEKMFKCGLQHVFDELLAFSKDFFRMPVPVQPPPRTIHSDLWDFAHLASLHSELWFGVRIFFEALANPVPNADEDLPASFSQFMQQATPGIVIRLHEQGEEAAKVAIAALGGTWEGGHAPAMSWP